MRPFVTIDEKERAVITVVVKDRAKIKMVNMIPAYPTAYLSEWK